jgi:hypothetical protein
VSYSNVGPGRYNRENAGSNAWLVTAGAGQFATGLDNAARLEVGQLVGGEAEEFAVNTRIVLA